MKAKVTNLLSALGCIILLTALFYALFFGWLEAAA